MISKSTIDSVYESARVEEVIGDFVQLKRAGSNWKGLSPFSDERSPSFMVSPAKGIWKDFSSGKGGNAIAFVMEHEHFTYPEAIRYLAKKYNIEIEETVQMTIAKACIWSANLQQNIFMTPCSTLIWDKPSDFHILKKEVLPLKQSKNFRLDILQKLGTHLQKKHSEKAISSNF